MSQDRRYVVPSGMFEFVNERFPNPTPAAVGAILNLGLRWLAENPIEPSESAFISLYDDCDKLGTGRLTYHAVIEWQRRMFLVPEPEVPEEIKDLLWEEAGFAGFTNDRQAYNENLKEAFRRGQRSKVKP